eukprot:jgi/Tetstr1/446728/TSEL_034216.t1
MSAAAQAEIVAADIPGTEQSRGFSEELSAKQDALAGAQKEILPAGTSAIIALDEQTRRHFAERSSMPAALADAQAQLLQAGTSAIKNIMENDTDTD